MRAVHVAVSVILASALVACGPSVAETPENTPVDQLSDAVTDGNLGVMCFPETTFAFPGDVMLMRANVRGHTNKEVLWTTEAGSVTDEAIFTAPNEIGTVVVTATAKADGQSKDTCLIHVIPRPETKPGSGAGAALSPHTALGLPGPANEDPAHYLLEKDEYVVSYNSARKNANWVAWQLDGLYFAGGTRTRTWRSDTSLPTEVPQATDKDYTNSGFDRGHMCPSGDRTRLEAANKVTFTLTNALPQVHNVNGGPWQDLEEYLQGLALDGREMYIVAGGVYDAQPQTIGRDVHVPSATWKVAVVLDRIGDGALQVQSTTRVIAVLMANDDMAVAIGEDWKNHRVRVRDIEAITGLDFLSDLDRGLQDVLEERVDAE